MASSMESDIRMGTWWSSSQVGTSSSANCSFLWNAQSIRSTWSWSSSSTKMSKSRPWWQCVSLECKPKTYTRTSPSSCWSTFRSTPPYRSRWISSSMWIQTPFLLRTCCPSSYTVVQTEPPLLAFGKKAAPYHTALILPDTWGKKKQKTLGQDWKTQRELNSTLPSPGKIQLRVKKRLLSEVSSRQKAGTQCGMVDRATYGNQEAWV